MKIIISLFNSMRIKWYKKDKNIKIIIVVNNLNNEITLFKRILN